MRRYEHGGDIYGGGIKLDFSVNTNPLGMPPAVKSALAEHAEDFARYPDPRCNKLRQALAKHHDLPVDRILCGNGAADLILRICACIRGKRALVLAPTFSEYERAVKLFGGEVLVYKLDIENGFLLGEDFISALERQKPDMVFVCNPNNPTGMLMPFEIMRETVGFCQKNGILLIVDECFIEFTDGQSVIPLLQDNPNLLVLRAFTKLYSMAGLRLGYLLGESRLLAMIESFGAAWSVSSPAQISGLASLGAEPEWTAYTKRVIAQERSFLIDELSSLGIKALPSDANFLLIESKLPLYRELRRRGILVRDCSNFTGLNGSFIRIGIKTRKENTFLIKALEEIVDG